MKLDDLKPAFLEVMRMLGLDACKCEVVERPGFPAQGLDLCFWYPLKDWDVRAATKSPAHFQAAMAQAIAPLRESIVRSPEVSSYVDDLERRARAAEAEVAELRPYKVHYEMEMQLRHGRDK